MRKDKAAEVIAVRLNPQASRDARAAQETIAAIAYLAILAYPCEWDKRDAFVKAAKAWLLKKWMHKNGKRELIDESYRTMKNQQIDGCLNRAFRRIARRRLPAAELADALVMNHCPNAAVYVNGRRVTARRWMEWRLSCQYGDSTLSNEFRRTWKETKPVLHLAMAYPRFVSKTETAFSPFEHPFALMMNPSWVAKAIQLAEGMRQILPVYISNFDASESVCLLLSY